MDRFYYISFLILPSQEDRDYFYFLPSVITTCVCRHSQFPHLTVFPATMWTGTSLDIGWVQHNLLPTTTPVYFLPCCVPTCQPYYYCLLYSSVLWTCSRPARTDYQLQHTAFCRPPLPLLHCFSCCSLTICQGRRTAGLRPYLEPYLLLILQWS